MKFRSVRNTSRQSAFNTPSKDTSPRCGYRAIKSLSNHVQLLSADQSFDYFGLANDMRLISAAREALVVLSSSPTPPSIALTHSGSSTGITGSSMPDHATNQVTAATTSVAGEPSSLSGANAASPYIALPPFTYALAPFAQLWKSDWRSFFYSSSSSATSNTPIFGRSPTPPLLYPPPSTSSAI
jgi:hypothetical protein